MDRNVKARRILVQGTCIIFLAYFTISSITQSQLYATEQQDTEPPTSNITLIGNRTENYFTSPVSVYISATDAPSGLNQGISYTAYRINSGTWIPYTGQFEIQLEGTYTISYFSEDYANNPELVKTTQFEINLNPPTPTQTPTLSPIQIISTTPTPEPTATTTLIPTEKISPSITPAKSPSPTQQSYWASLPYYRSPTKTPTPTPIKIKTISSFRPTTSKTVSLAPTPTVQIVQEAERTDRNETPTVLGQRTRVDNDQSESFDSLLLMIFALALGGAYIYLIIYLYSKIYK